MRIGLYFGSFNPIHIGHLLIASFIINKKHADQVWLVVSPHNPLKQEHSLLNAYQRLYLAQLAVQEHPHIKVMDTEFHLPKPSYTIDTLTFLSTRYKNSDYQFSVIMGSDSLHNLHRWKNYKDILALYSLLVYQREGFPIQAQENVLSMQAPIFPISSSMIREHIKKGISIRYLVPDLVREEIEKAGYYK